MAVLISLPFSGASHGAWNQVQADLPYYPGTMARKKEVTGKTMNGFMLLIPFISLKTSANSSKSTITGITSTFP